MISEFSLIEWISRRAPSPAEGLGIGDDAAVVKCRPGFELAVTTDAIVENVDFVRGRLPAALAGRKALAVNLSDAAAMGAEPRFFLMTLGIPRGMSQRWIRAFCEGTFQLARRYSVSCVGGDLSKSSVFFASITLMAEVKKGAEIRRSGAQAGDLIYVTGELGGSLSGRHASFEPRVREALFLAEKFRPTAMLDVSDGLVQDLGHLLKSSGVSAEIDLDAVPVSKAARSRAQGLSDQALQHALSDGEDFELVMSVPRTKAPAMEAAWKKKFPQTRFTRIGRIENGAQKMRFTRAGRPDPAFRMTRKGYDHFEP